MAADNTRRLEDSVDRPARNLAAAMIFTDKNQGFIECECIRIGIRSRMHTPGLVAVLAAVLTTTISLAQPKGTAVMPDRLLYTPTNLAVDDNITSLTTLIDRAGKAGYSGILLADSKFARLGDLPEHYFANCRKVMAAAEQQGLEIIPAVFPVGYSNDLLWHDPNLAEALPVRDAVFVVEGGAARCRPDRQPSLPGGDMSNLSKWSWHDEIVTSDGRCATVTDPKGRNARLSQKLTLTPYRQYHVSVRIRTKDFRGTPEIKALVSTGKDEPASLVFSSLGVKPTQEWRTHHAVFNSLDHTEVTLYFGCWDGSTGALSWDDSLIEEVGLLNVVRRKGAPLSVQIETKDGRTPLVEGTDFEPVVDPRMGHPLNLWPGEYDVWHEPPAITLKKPLKDGTRLRVSYYHVVTVNDGQVMICPSEPRTLELLRDQARRMHELWHTKAYWMSHDEVRCLNQDESCRSRGLSAGQILADNARECVKILKEINPGGRIYVWSDMFDPNHNARPGNENYYLVRGDLAGSWEGLDKDVIIGAWYFEKRAESLAFFAERGHPLLIAGYYDGPPGVGVRQITQWLSAVPPKADLRGVLYTTWQQRYGDLEPFAAQAWGK